jgi:transcriptional regulator with XRE-family HTH domain
MPIVPGVKQSIGRNLRRWRTARGVTVTALAEEAGVAKSTVSMIERGVGNPSIDTVWALAAALGVPFATLVGEDGGSDGDFTVVREAEVPIIAADSAGLDTDGLIARHMLTRVDASLIEIYTLVLEVGAIRHAEPHVPGLYEHVTVAAGSLEISTDSFAEVLEAGDLISFRADRPHSYRVLSGPVRLVSVHEYPNHPV